jgi:hypothetical protein
MKLVQELVNNSNNPLLIVEQWNVDWRSEWKSPEVRNDNDRMIVISFFVLNGSYSCLEKKKEVLICVTISH